MSEKKTVSKTEAGKTTAKKRAKKKSAPRAKKDTNAADARKKVSKVVQAKAVKMTQAVIGETDEGKLKDLQLAAVKYLFEVAEIYPPRADQDAATADEDCLAKTLLNRLNIPDEPIRRDEDEDSVSVEKTIAEAPVVESEQKNAVAKDADTKSSQD